MTGVLEEVSGTRRSLLSFQYGCEKGLTFHQLAVVTVDRRPMTEEYEAFTIYKNLRIQFIWGSYTTMVSIFSYSLIMRKKGVSDRVVGQSKKGGDGGHET